MAVALAPDGTTLASAGGDGVKLWNVATGMLLRPLDAGAGELVLTLAFSPDGRQLAGGGTGRTAKPDGRLQGAAVGDEAVKVLPLEPG